MDLQAKIDFFYRLLGYFITGSVDYHILPVLYGDHGRNGKGTLFDTLEHVLGPYISTYPKELILQNKNGITRNAPDEAMLSLRGQRSAWISELNQDEHVDIGLMKKLSGADHIRARGIHAKRAIQFRPTHKLVLQTNYRLRVSADEDPMWARLVYITFPNSYLENPDPSNPRQKPLDTTMPKRLKAESEGLLVKLVRGCEELQKRGLDTPRGVIDALNEARNEEDTIGKWLNDCATVAAGMKCTAKPAYDLYAAWCKDNGRMSSSSEKFWKRLESKFRRAMSGGYSTFYGFGLNDGNHKTDDAIDIVVVLEFINNNRFDEARDQISRCAAKYRPLLTNTLQDKESGATLLEQEIVF